VSKNVETSSRRFVLVAEWLVFGDAAWQGWSPMGTASANRSLFPGRGEEMRWLLIFRT
jgi:hypothetical protein